MSPLTTDTPRPTSNYPSVARSSLTFTKATPKIRTVTKAQSIAIQYHHPTSRSPLAVAKHQPQARLAEGVHLLLRLLQSLHPQSPKYRGQGAYLPELLQVLYLRR